MNLLSAIPTFVKTKRIVRQAFFGLTLMLVTLVAGCGGGDSDVVPEPTELPEKDAAAGQLRLDASAFDMQKLLDHENKIIANNAKPLKAAFDANNYANATQALLMMSSVVDIDSSTQSVIGKALRQVRDVAGAAADNGDPNARYALDRLSEVFSR